MTTITQYKVPYAPVVFGYTKILHPKTQSPQTVSALESGQDVLEIRFGQAQSVEERARAFSQKHGQRLHQLAVNTSREIWNIFSQPPGASEDQLRTAERATLIARLNTPAHEELTQLLQPQNAGQIKDAWLRKHLELLKEEGHIQPDKPPNKRLIEMEARVQETQIKNPEDPDALRKARNAFARAKRQPNFFDFKLAQDGLTFEDLERFYKQVASKTKTLDTSKWKLYQAARFGLHYTLSPNEINILRTQGLAPQDLDLDRILAEQNISSEELLLKTARVIEQEEPMEKILEKSLKKSASSYGRGGCLVPIDAPHEIGALVEFPQGPAETHKSEKILHEILGHGLNYSFLDPHLPPQFREEPFSGIMDEGMGELWEHLLYTKAFWTKVLDLPSQTVEKLQKVFAIERLTRISGMRLDPIANERRAYIDDSQPLPYGRPGYLHTYDLGVAWAAQLEAAMNNKYGDLLNPEAWREIKKVFSLGKLLNWQEQIKLLTSKPKEIDRIVGLLRGDYKAFQQGKRELHEETSGKYFSTEALLQEINDLTQEINTPQTS